MARDPRLFDASASLAERVTAAFSKDGPLAQAFPGFRPRGGQLGFALALAETLQKEGTLVAEAGTGTGKTFAYLTPALLSGLTVIISTGGKPLQDQLYKKDVPMLSRALGVHPKTAVLKGRANYVCLERLMHVAEDGVPLPERNSHAKLRKIVRFAQITKTGDRSELAEVPENDPLWPMVTSTRENCLGPDRCPHYGECFVKRARDEAQSAQIVIVNHHLYLSSVALKRENQGMDGMLPTADLTVFDEAHQLPAVATAFFGTRFSTYQVEDIAHEAEALGKSYAADGADWTKICGAVRKAVDELKLSCYAVGLTEGDRKAVETIERFGELAGPMATLLKAFAKLGEALKTNAGRRDEIDVLRAYHAEVLDEMDNWKHVATATKPPTASADTEAANAEIPASSPAVADVMTAAPSNAPQPTDKDREIAERLVKKNTPKGPAVRWVEVMKSGIRFNLTPLSFAGEFREMRKAEGGSWLFTSATLSTGGKAGAANTAADFGHYLREVGLSPEECRAEQWPSPFNYWEQGVFYLPDLPPPERNTIEHVERVVEAAWPLIVAAGGKTFFLCTSIAGMERAADLLEDKIKTNGLDYPLLVQNEMPRNALIEEFRRRGNAVLVGSMSFWEGVDVRGDALSLVVIDKIPFTPPDDPVTNARCEAIRASGKHPFFVHSVPEAVISLKQGAGRLIRSETDRGVFMLGDSRVLTKGYGKTVLASLPDFYKTRQLGKVLTFFADPERFREDLYC